MDNNASPPSDVYLSDTNLQDSSQSHDKNPLHQPLPDSEETNSNMSVDASNSGLEDDGILIFNDEEGQNIP